MFFGTKSQLTKTRGIHTYCGDQELEIVSVYKYLGMMLDIELNFKANAEYIVSKIIRRIGTLGRARGLIRDSTALYLYEQLIMPLLDYEDFIYDGSYQISLHTLQILQNTAARKILKARRLTPTIDLHTELNIDTLHVGRIKHTCTMTYKILHGLTRKQLCRLFKKGKDVSARSTRSSDQDLYLTKPRLELTIAAY